MQIGLPAETKEGERRVALVPAAVADLVAAGHAVRVQAGAGARAGFPDGAYAAAGARLVERAEAAFDAELVVKVKEIQDEAEWKRLHAGGMLFSFLHLAADPRMADALIDRRVTALAFETVEDGAKRLALLAPMSVIAGELSIPLAAHLSMAQQGGRGIAIGDARVLVLGAGSAGRAAARTAARLGAVVTVLSRPGMRLTSLAIEPGIAAAALTPASLAATIVDADVVIGAVNVPGERAPTLVLRGHLQAMTAAHGAGAVLVDIGIDAGGIAETSRATTHGAPTYVEDGVIHCCVPNLPAAVPRSASQALSSAVLPRVLALAGKGLLRALREDAGLVAGLQLHAGKVTHPGVAAQLGRPHHDLDAVLFSC